MHIMQSRRDFLASAVSGRRRGRPWRPGIARRRGAAGDDHDPAGDGHDICVAPTYIAEELLRAEGFTDIRYIPAQGGFTAAQMIATRRDRLRHDPRSVARLAPGCRRSRSR